MGGGAGLQLERKRAVVEGFPSPPDEMRPAGAESGWDGVFGGEMRSGRSAVASAGWMWGPPWA